MKHCKNMLNNMNKILLGASVFIGTMAFVLAETPVVEVYENQIPFMYIEYGPGTVLTEGTSITTKPCEIDRIHMNHDGIITIECTKMVE